MRIWQQTKRTPHRREFSAEAPPQLDISHQSAIIAALFTAVVGPRGSSLAQATAVPRPLTDVARPCGVI